MKSLGRTELRTRRSIGDLVNVLLLSFVTTFVIGTQAWTGSYTPDSEFYASLGRFGSQVTDRAPTPAYYWTRTAVIAPLKFLNSFLGYELSWQTYRFFLITLVIASTFLTTKRISRSRYVASLLSLLVATNSTVLYFQGDSYVTGTAISWLFVALALVLWGPQSLLIRALKYFGVGLVIACLLFTNPTSALIALALSIGLTGQKLFVSDKRFREVGIASILHLFGFVSGLVLLLFLSRRIFPDLNWISTVRFYSKTLKPSDYSSKDVSKWLKTDYSLLVPLMAMAVTGIVASVRRHDLFSHFLVVSIPSVVYLIIFFQSGGPVFEASYYSAMLWPTALIGLALLSAQVFGDHEIGEKSTSTGLLLGALVLSRFFGSYSTVFGWTRLLSIVVGLAAGLFVAVSTAKLRFNQAVLLVVATLFPLFQVLQNSRPATMGVAARQPYSLAYAPSDLRLQMRQNMEIENWVLASTERADKVLVYGDIVGNQVSPAAMQLWGPNAASSGVSPSDWDQRNLEVVKPSVIVSYFPSTPTDRGRRKIFMDNLLAGRPLEESPICRSFSRHAPAVEVCIHNLIWPTY